MLRRVPLAVLIVSCLSTFAHAQSGVNGSIVGNVFDQTGAPIKGVKVSARSDTQIGGAKVTYTNDEGFFRIPGLQPGDFEVTGTAPKLKSVLQKGVKVGVTSVVDVSLIMEVETAVEEVKVIERAPVVSTTTANVKEVFDADFVEGLPTIERWAVESFVGYNTPGASYQSLRSVRFRGGGTEQNAFNVEGFKMNGQKITTKSLAALEVNTAGYGAENANVPGGVVNMVSKSGSNKFEIDLSGWADDSNLQFFTDSSDSASHNYNLYINPAFSGPIIKDRVWFYLNTEMRRQHRDADPDPSGFNIIESPRGFDYLNGRASLKLTWQVSSRHKLSTYSSFNRDMHRRNQNDRYNREVEAQRNQDNHDIFTGIIWEALLADNLFFRSQVGVQQFLTENRPYICGERPDECDHIPQVQNTFPRQLFTQNDNIHQFTTERSWEVINQLEWFANSKVFGEHNVKARSRLYGELYDDAQSTPGDYYTIYNGVTPERRRTYFSNDPRFEDPRFGYRIAGSTAFTTVTSLSDSIRMTRYLTLSPGVAFTTARANNVAESANINPKAFTPHLSAAWDATHDGRTVVRASYNQYVDTDAIRLARFSLGDRTYRECRATFDADGEFNGVYDRECTWGGGSASRTFGLPCGPSGINPDGSSCKEKLKIPRTYEYTAGIEREILPGVGIGSDLIYRLYTYPYEDGETNRIWNPSGYALDSYGGYRTGRNETITNLGTPENARRRYLGVSTTIHKREGKLRATAGYTWSSLEGNVNNNQNNDFGTNPYRDEQYLYGYLPDDLRHVIKASMTYQWTNWLSTGMIYQYRSGGPYQRRFRNDQLGSFSDYRARVGVNPAGNINDPDDDRPLRRPDIQEFNLQIRVNMKPLTGINLDAFVDVMNVLALRTTTGYQENDGPQWSQPTTRLPPFRTRVGFRWRY